jgi:succinyl-CoA synthetase beta subunit
VAIEEVAKKDPQAIIKISIDPKVGFTREMAKNAAFRLFFQSNVDQVAEQLQKMYEFFVSHDCTQFEINPFVETPTGEVLCLDAKLNFDSSAEFRHQDIFALHDQSQEDPREVHAQKFGLNYIALNGNVGCLVNGAGLAMATMDVIKHKGGEPANFLDVGGSATEEQVYEALKIMENDTSVQAILVNIFGGIMRCDVIAKGLINAVEKLGLRKPLVVRLKGTNQDIAVKMLEKSKLRLIPADDLDDAAKKAVHIAAIAHTAKGINLTVNFEMS